MPAWPSVCLCLLRSAERAQEALLLLAQHERGNLSSPGAEPAAPHVRAERHFHPVKAQLVTAAGMGALTVAATALLAPMLGVSPWSLVGVEQAFWACMVCASAGQSTCQPETALKISEKAMQCEQCARLQQREPTCLDN